MRSKNTHDEEEHENHERWLVSYADFITLLFAFFVVMYATSSGNKQKQQEFEKSIKKYMVKMFGGFGSSSGQQGGSKLDQARQFDAPIENPLKKFNSPKATSETLELVETQLEQKLSEKQFERFIFDITTTDWGVRISLKSNGIFVDGETSLKRDSLEFLAKLAAVLKTLNYPIIFEGHTIRHPRLSKAISSRWELSTMRATILLRFFIKAHDLDEKNLSATGYGSTRPLVDPSSETELTRNNRLDILVLTEGHPI